MIKQLVGIGISSLTVLTVFNFPKAAQAAALACPPGVNWVSNCTSGSFQFESNILLNLDIKPEFLPPGLPTTVFPTHIKGPRSIAIGTPVDAIQNDPVLGNVGTVDGKLDVVRTETYVSVAKGQPVFLMGKTVTVVTGDGVPDLTPTPAGSTPPYVSLSASEYIKQRTDDPTLADQVFELFIEAQGTNEGVLRNKTPLILRSSTPLTQFPFINSIDFISTDITTLYSAGPDGQFWTGDEIAVANLTPNAQGASAVLNLRAVPEPSNVVSVVGFGLALGFLAKSKMMKKG